MKVEDLIELLKELPQHYPVYSSGGLITAVNVRLRDRVSLFTEEENDNYDIDKTATKTSKYEQK